MARPFTWIASAIFALMALVHIYRLFTHFQITIGSHAIPMWVSYVAIVVTAVLSWMLCRERGERAGRKPDQTLKRNSRTSPSCTT